MASQALRTELETVYNAYVTALKKQDQAAFAKVAYGVEGAGEVDPSEFAEATAFMLEMAPELSETTFLTVKTEGDDLAGHYCIFKEPDFTSVVLTTFVKVDGRWKRAPATTSVSFGSKPGEDIAAKAMKLIEIDEDLKLKRPEAAAMGPGVPDGDLQAAISCMAYDYEVKVAINGVALSLTGGKSQSLRLFGVAAGAAPAAPVVLQAGENRIEVEYRKTRSNRPSRLTVEIVAMPERYCFRLVSAERPAGKVSAAFTLPADEAEEATLVEIDDDNP